MGHKTMKIANGNVYRDIKGMDFRLLMYLAERTLDDSANTAPEDARRWYGGYEQIIERLYGEGLSGKAYDSARRAVSRSFKSLVAVDAICQQVRAAGRKHAKYEVCPMPRRANSRTSASGYLDDVAGQLCPEQPDTCVRIAGHPRPNSRTPVSAPIEESKGREQEGQEHSTSHQSAEEPSAARWLDRARRISE
jgi:hypothetical protein